MWKRNVAVFCDVSKMHRSHGNYIEQRLKLILFLVCVYVYMYASNFATLNNTHFILLHECINPMNRMLVLLILNRMTGRYTPDSTVSLSAILVYWNSTSLGHRNPQCEILWATRITTVGSETTQLHAQKCFPEADHGFAYGLWFCSVSHPHYWAPKLLMLNTV